VTIIRSSTPAPTPAGPLPLLRAQEVAVLLAISTRTVWRFARSGRLPSVAVGSALRFTLADVQRFIQVNRRETPADVTPLRRGGQRLQVSELRRWK
jgi:excisionase family DNA binding protein